MQNYHTMSKLEKGSWLHLFVRIRHRNYVLEYLVEKMLETNFSQAQIIQMRNEGKIVFYKVTDRDEYLYEPQKTNKYLAKI